ncbi:uncharacterized protein BCR38DRAFT_218524 [Pseudomassariella vexata]|uniref:Uncharacterized protein n=1 Tax=Pseudomassariella vexata TaxID=1141098 RepID=A0A1Y2DUN5_9PEZI|nr:uncharacterized protein BCR38DRAFT_218524 [Pseudomassariella vexata]ORY62971.1 hypothetical protein BCR38DRAFT_218524 [Pseudomassariella vexata]
MSWALGVKPIQSGSFALCALQRSGSANRMLVVLCLEERAEQFPTGSLDGAALVLKLKGAFPQGSFGTLIDRAPPSQICPGRHGRVHQALRYPTSLPRAGKHHLTWGGLSDWQLPGEPLVRVLPGTMRRQQTFSLGQNSPPIKYAKASKLRRVKTVHSHFRKKCCPQLVRPARFAG